MFRGVSVLLDEQPPQCGALAHAAEWAGRLSLPLRTVPGPESATEFFRPFELSVFGGALRRMLLARSLRSPQAAVLTGPPTWRPLSRMLVLNQHRRPADGFLDTVAAVCRTFQAAPVVLTVARSEAEARARERVVEEAFACRRLAVDCDFVAGSDATTAVARAARWRRCSHVFVERRPAPPWRRWLGGGVLRELACLADSLTLVALPGTPSSPQGDCICG